MDVAQIGDGDFSSIAGSWRNAYGDSVTITGGKLVASGADDSGGCTKGCTLAPSEPDGSGPVAYVNLDGTGQIESPPALVLVPAGVEAIPGDATDTGRDRISIQTNGGADAWKDPGIAGGIYYRAG